MRYPWKPGIDAWPDNQRPYRWGCGGAAVGLIIGVMLTLLVLILLAPRPLPALPAAGTGSNISVSINDLYLTNVVSTAIDGAALPIQLSHVQAEILPGRQVVLSGNADGPLATTTQLIAVAQVGAQSGHLVLHILSAHVGGLPLPVTVTTALERPINSRLAQANQRFLPPGYVVIGVNTTAHYLLMTIAQQ